jgi:probable rRNA maturation factor
MAARVLRQAGAAERADGVVSVLLADDSAVADLNQSWRGRAGPTNVLSFPGAPTVRGQGALGDIALAFDTIAAEAAAQAKTFEAHASHLLVHGFLHLLGYDHVAETDAVHMEGRERAILAALGIADPYAERVHS